MNSLELRLYGVLKKFALRVGLLLYDRLGWLSGGYGVCVTMHYFPLSLFRPKDRRNPHGNRADIIPPLNLGLASLYLHCVGKLRGCVLRYVLEAGGLAISVVRCGTLQGRSDLIPSTCGWAKGVSEGYIVSTGVDSFITTRNRSWRARLTRSQVPSLSAIV